jgi:hypothetical protein
VLKDTSGELSAEILNTRDDPQRVRSVHRTELVRGSKLALALDPFSLTLYEVPLKPH